MSYHHDNSYTDAVDSDAEEYQEQLAEIDEEEFPVEEDEEPEEEYQDVYERMKAGMIEMFEEQTDSYSSIQVCFIHKQCRYYHNVIFAGCTV